LSCPPRRSRRQRRLDEERGGCYVELGRPNQAEPILLRALGGRLSLRRRATVLSDLAMVGIQRKDADQVVNYASEVADIAEYTGSGVVGQKLRGLKRRWQPLMGDIRMRDLDERITTLAGTPTIG
jgi:hypothetical protein